MANQVRRVRGLQQQVIRYPVITRRDRLAAAWSGFRDGRKSLPSTQAGDDVLPPACAALHGQYTSLLSRMERLYREAESGFEAPLQAALAALRTSVTGDPTQRGAVGRSVRSRGIARQAAIAQGIEASDELLHLHAQAMTDYVCARALATQVMGVYTLHLYRWHPESQSLSARDWHPPALPLPEERISARADLLRLVKSLKVAVEAGDVT